MSTQLLESHVSTQLGEVQKICAEIARFTISDEANIRQLERDLCTLRGNLYLAEIKISQAEESLQRMKQRRIKLNP